MVGDNDLRDTLQQLCSDLLVASISSDDRRGILKSMTLLVSQFPHAQSALGRILADKAPSQRYESVESPRVHSFRPLLVDITTTCMYHQSTSQSMIELLAALAESNIINQRRIARWIPGVRLSLDTFTSGKRAKSISIAGKEVKKELYILTVPKALKKTYHKWRKRQRTVIGPEGRNTRTPTGAPPTKDGVPAPCYCDDCLGAEQLLATWYRHFNDLDRWTCDENREDADQRKPVPVLTAFEFFQLEMTEYRLQTHRCSFAPQQLPDGVVQAPLKSAKTFYFVPREEKEDRMATFDPNVHACGILIFTDVLDTIEKSRQLSPPHDKYSSSESSEKISNEVDDHEDINSLDKVVLFQDVIAIRICSTGDSSRNSNQAEHDSAMMYGKVNNEGLFASLLAMIKEKYGDESFSRAELMMLIEGNAGSSLVCESVQVVLQRVLIFLSEDERFSFRGLLSGFGGKSDAGSNSDVADVLALSQRSKEITCDDMELFEAQTTVTALISEQILQIECISFYKSTHEGFGTVNELPKVKFVVSIPKTEVCLHTTLPDTPFALLYLTDDDIRSLLSHCLLCRCSSTQMVQPHALDQPLWYLMHSHAINQEEKPNSSEQCENGTLEFYRASLKSPLEKQAPHLLPGLSDEAKQILTRLDCSVGGDKSQLNDTEAVNSLVKRLTLVIGSCNARINLLATPRASGSANAKLAASNRCRLCRDELIQLCKQIRIEQEKQAKATRGACAGGARDLVAARKRESRFQAMVRASIQSVLHLSKQFDDWETPDERVSKLQLDRNVWASGVPDFEFFREKDARATENKRLQRELSRNMQRQRRDADT